MCEWVWALCAWLAWMKICVVPACSNASSLQRVSLCSARQLLASQRTKPRFTLLTASSFLLFLPYSCYCSLFKIKYVNAKTITSHLINNKYHFFAAVLQDVGFSSDKWSKNDVSLAPPVCEVEAKSSCCPTNSSLNVSDSKAPFDVANDSRRIYTVLDELMMSPFDWIAKIIVKFFFFCWKRCVYVYLNSVFDRLFFNSKEYWPLLVSINSRRL